MSENISHLTGRKGLKKNLLEELHNRSVDGALPQQAIKKVANDYLIGEANVLGATSFYDFLRPDNRDKKVHICNGSACLVAGTQDHLKSKLLKHFKEEEIGHMCCMGRCHENGSFHYQGQNYSACSEETIDEIVKKGRVDSYDVYHVQSDLEKPVLITDKSLKELMPLLQAALDRSPEELLAEIQQSGLRGRGGAGFPMGIKIKACKSAQSDEKYIVCNADEGDPGSYSDRYLLEHQPHSVLFGMFIAGYIAGASTGVVYLRAEYPEAVEILQLAIDEWHTLSVAYNFTFKLVNGAGSYVVGEETALLSSIEGQRPEVRVRPPYPVEKGLYNQPTLVNNVETFANIPFIVEHGGESFSQIGTGKSTGTKLLSLDSIFQRPGVYEVEMGTPLDYIINKLGQGFKKPVKALHIGGPLGGVVTAALFEDLAIDFESFKSHGFELGHASIVSIPEDFPMINYLRHLFEFVSAESCGKCFPCRLGSKRGFEMLELALKNKKPINSELFHDLLDTLKNGSLCGLGSGLTTPVRNILTYFSAELVPYFDEMKPEMSV